MAERRMFAKTIVDSDAFLDMPIASQCLYFHLAMRADDEGFVNKAKSVARVVGAKEEDFRPLIERRFVIVFDDGVLVIKHWRIHNWIRTDRLQPTKYQQHKNTLSFDENNAYSDQPTGTCQPSVRQLTDKCHTEVRLGKDSIDKDSKDISPKGENDGFEKFWIEYPRKTARATALKSWKKIKPDAEMQETILSALEQHKKTEQWTRDKGQFIPHPATWLNQCRWQDELESTVPQPVAPARLRKFERREVDGEWVDVEVFD